MVGDTLVGGPKPEWKSYELAFKDQDNFYAMMSNDPQG